MVKTMTAMEVRKHFGAVMDEVRLKSETVILERAGRPIAMIKPIVADSQAGEEQRSQRLDALNHLKGLCADHPRSSDLDGWLEQERGGWDGRL